MTILKPNLAFGPQTHLIHFLTQCAIVGKCPYKNIISKENTFEFSPIHTDDIATAMGEALSSSRPGRFSLNGAETMTLREVMNALEVRAGRTEGATSGPLIPTLDLLWDFFVGTTSDLNMSRMIDFYEQNKQLQADHHANPWDVKHSQSFQGFVKSQTLTEENFSHPTMAAYRCAHTD